MAFLAGAVLLTVPRPTALIVAAIVCLSGPVLVKCLGFDHRNALGVFLSTLVTAGSVYGIAQLSLFVARLHATQNHAARTAVEKERDRVARDLHDVLGSALALIAFRATTGAEGDEPAAALDEIAGIARRTLAEVRAVSRNNAALTASEELAQAVHVLSTAGITVHSDIAPTGVEELPKAVDHCLAVIAREAVTNVLRHSSATPCSLLLSIDGKTATDRFVELSVGNDIAASSTTGTAAPGTGLTNLAARAAAPDGTLAIERPSPRQFLLLVRLPLPSPAAAH
ncbi:sensor histidine kinase, partial [Streptomyces sp. NPDC057545]|uniref:sensor histidine kinase n=1 Tax=Streptomyces sp. NPDC057545 TaxID=3346164 RepID=UPI00368861B2